MGKNPFESDEPVRFILGDTGVKVSNDPRANEEDWMEKALAKIENTGRATVHDNELHEQLGTGQQVGTMTGEQIQPPAMPVRIVGVDDSVGPAAGTTPDSDPDDDEVGDDDESTPVEEMTGKELKVEVKRLKSEEGIEVDTTGITKVGELRKAVLKAKADAEKS